ncbi:hypothetical protein D3C72_1832120 [compost metagenome]
MEIVDIITTKILVDGITATNWYSRKVGVEPFSHDRTKFVTAVEDAVFINHKWSITIAIC